MQQPQLKVHDPKTVDTSIIAHAKRELEIAGLLDPDDEMQALANDNVMELLRVFANQEHSGFSASYVLRMFTTLVNREAISPNDHSLCMDVSDYSGGRPMLQDIRDSRWFSNDGGVTWWNCEEKPLQSTKNLTPEEKATIKSEFESQRVGLNEGEELILEPLEPDNGSD